MAEFTASRNNALPYPVYGLPYVVSFPLLDADGDPVSPSSPDSEISKNGDTFADCTNEAVEIASSSGICYLSLTGTEMTADLVTLRIQSTGAKTTVLTLCPRKLVSIRTGTSASGGVSTSTIVFDASASAVDDFYNGMICSAVIDGTTEVRMITDYTGSSNTASVVPDWNTAPDNNDTFTIYRPDGVQVQQANTTHVNSTAQTARDLGASVLLSSGTGTGQLSISNGVVSSNVTQIGGVAQSATDLKDFADTGYDPATHKVQGVVLVDTTTTNTDMRGTDNAAQAGDEMDLVDAPNSTALDAIAASMEAAILDEGDATALLAAIAAKVEEFLVNDGDATATLAAIATAVWANATRTLTAGTNIQLPSNGLANVTAWTVAITGNITGNLSGSVGSVTGGINTAAGTIQTLDALDTAQDAQHSTTQGRLPPTLTADNMMKVDVRYVNGTEVGGSGTSGDPWGPA